MSRYIRTIDGRIIDLNSKLVSSYEIIDDNTAKEEYGEDNGFICVYYFDEDIGEHIEYDNKGGRSMDNWYLKDIIKEADTIEELCDEIVREPLYPNVVSSKPFILITKYNPITETLLIARRRILEEQYRQLKLVSKGKLNIYGAIWTDKGLIYVAKMNDKGELELI